MMKIILELIDEIRILFYLNRLMVRQHMSLIADWWVGVAGMLIEQGTAIGFLSVIFYRIDTIKGWGIHDMIFLLGLSILAKPVYRIFFQGAHDIPSLILTGNLDQILVRPRHPLILILSNNTNPVAVGDIAWGLILLVYAGENTVFTWSPVNILFLISVILSGSLIYTGALLLKGAACVFLIKFEAMNALLQQFQQYAKYPVSIYNRFLKIILITVLPYCFVSSVPAAVILGRDGIPNVAWLTPLAGFAYFCLTGFILSWSLRFYKSAGS